MQGDPRDATIVLFGGTGDLATRKLIPSLFHLWRQDSVGTPLILALGRRVDSRDEYCTYLRDCIPEATEHPEPWDEFEKHIHFFLFDVEDRGVFANLRGEIERREREADLPGRRLYYLSVAPSLFGTIVSGLGEAGLLEREQEPETPDAPRPTDRWCRLVVEKPFGHDLRSSIALDEAIHAWVNERQVFRIDHYLGKDTVQNLLAFRFANGMIEPLWRSTYIDEVTLTVAERMGIGQRGGYYDGVGALRDMMQNHMMQLLSLTAMEPPISMGADDLRNEKVKVLRAIRLPADAREVARTTVRAQYERAEIDGQRVPGYLQEEGIDAGSTTPTFVAAELAIDNWRWTGVPFRLVHGKRLERKTTEISIRFKTPPMPLFASVGCADECPNILTIRIQPNEGISIRIGAKPPAGPFNIRPVELSFDYSSYFGDQLPDAYERLLLDALRGDAALFPRSDEVRAAWRWADAITDAWTELGREGLTTYPAGSSGPDRPWQD